MNEHSKPVFLKGKLHQIREPAGITYFAGNVIVVVTSKDKDSLLKEKALSVDEILKAMHEEGYNSLTTEAILDFLEKYNIIYYDFFLTLIKKLFKIVKEKVPEITIERYYDAIGKETMNIGRHKALCLLGEKFALFGERIEDTNFLQKLKNILNELTSIVKGQRTKNPRFLYKNLGYYCITLNCLKFIIHESEEDIKNNRIGIEYIFQRDFDFYDEFNVWYSKSTLKWMPIGCGCSKLSEVDFTIKNGNPFFIVRYFPEKVSIKSFFDFFRKRNRIYNEMVVEQIQQEIEISQKKELLEEYSYEIFWLQSQLNEFLSEIPENERAKRIHDIMRSILHDWDKHIKNIEYFGAKLEDGLESINLSISPLDKGEGEKLSDYIKLAKYITFESKNFNKSIEAIRNYNNFINNFEKVNINKLIKTIFDVEKHKIWKYKNALFFAPETENILISANAYQINNMISNLIDNTVNHGDINHPEFYINLYVSLSSLPPLLSKLSIPYISSPLKGEEKGEGEYLKILVKNKGVISRQNYENLINACKKGEKFTTSKKGEGQGLKNVIEIINNHNGKYVIPYNGEKFIVIVYLPIVDFREGEDIKG